MFAIGALLPVEAAQRLVELYDALGNTYKAQEWRKHLAELSMK